MNVWGVPTQHLKRQLDRCTHFCTTMQQSHTAWNTITYLWRQNVTFIEPDMWPPSSPDLNPVNYTIWVVLHFLLYAVYICQKSLNFTYAFKCYQQNCSWLHFTWPTLYIRPSELERFPVGRAISEIRWQKEKEERNFSSKTEYLRPLGGRRYNKASMVNVVIESCGCWLMDADVAGLPPGTTNGLALAIIFTGIAVAVIYCIHRYNHNS